MNNNIRRFNNDKPHGYWEIYNNGYGDHLSYKCFFINGLRNGYEEDYYSYNIYLNFHL